MGWSCVHCGDINPSDDDSCEECGTKQGVGTSTRVEAQPIGAGVLWLSTLLGGVLAGYVITVWNGRVLRKHSWTTTGLFTVAGILGWLATVWILANFEPAHEITFPTITWEPGFAIPIALSLAFLMVALPYNLDNLAVNQWMWNHPGRRLVFSIGPGGIGLRHTSFSGASGDLFGAAADRKPWLSIPVLPVAFVLISLGIGIATLALGNLVAPAAPAHPSNGF